MIVHGSAYSPYHIPVLCARSADLLVTRTDGIYIDGTCGGGGHTKEIINRLDSFARVIAIDQDEEAIAQCKTVLSSDDRVTVIKQNFANIKLILSQLNLQHIDGMLLDLGVSSRQIDSPQRGFSYRIAGDLDMRMNREMSLTARDIIATESSENLANIFYRYGEEKLSRRIADAIVEARKKKPIRSTVEFVRIIEPVIPQRIRTKVFSRVFQALRIVVNDELNNLKQALTDTLPLLSRGGRIVVISYHSLEDRLVKTFFKNESKGCICPPRTPVCVCGKIQQMKLITHKPLTPCTDEISHNPRARSAKLRAAEKIF